MLKVSGVMSFCAEGSLSRLQEVLAKEQQSQGGRKVSKTKLNNMIMQMRKNCNHPDLISSAFTNDVLYPSSDELRKQSGKLQLLDRLLKKLKAKGHRVLIFSQVKPRLVSGCAVGHQIASFQGEFGL